MNFSKADIAAANARLLDDPKIIARLRDEIEMLANDAAQHGCVEWAVEPADLSNAVISQKVHLAKINLPNEDRAMRLLRVEQVLADVRDLSARRIAWAKEQHRTRDEARSRDKLEAHRRSIAEQWPHTGPGKTLLQALSKAQREFEVSRGTLKLGADLTAWRSDIAKAAQTLLEEIDDAIELIAPQEAKLRKSEAA